MIKSYYCLLARHRNDGRDYGTLGPFVAMFPQRDVFPPNSTVRAYSQASAEIAHDQSKRPGIGRAAMCVPGVVGHALDDHVRRLPSISLCVVALTRRATLSLLGHAGIKRSVYNFDLSLSLSSTGLSRRIRSRAATRTAENGAQKLQVLRIRCGLTPCQHSGIAHSRKVWGFVPFACKSPTRCH